MFKSIKYFIKAKDRTKNRFEAESIAKSLAKVVTHFHHPDIPKDKTQEIN